MGQIPLGQIPSGFVLDVLEGRALVPQTPLQGARVHGQGVGHLGVAASACAQQPFDHRADLDRK